MIVAIVVALLIVVVILVKLQASQAPFTPQQGQHLMDGEVTTAGLLSNLLKHKRINIKKGMGQKANTRGTWCGTPRSSRVATTA